MICSHPNKPYKNHIENIAKSFDDINHKECAKYHDFAKQSINFQNYINLNIKDFDSQEELEKQRKKLKTTHSFESAYVYFFTKEDKDIDFIINLAVILKHHSNLKDFKTLINDLTLIEQNLTVPSIENNILSSIKSANLDTQILGKDKVYEFIDFFEEILENSEEFRKIENFFKFKDRFSKLILADKFEAIFDKPYQNLPFLDSKTCKNIIQNIRNEISSKPKNEYKNSSRNIIFKNYENNKDKNKFLIKAPTGIGKTYIALELALKIAINKPKKRIITAIPFTSIIDQTFIEYQKVMPKDISVLKYHHLSKYTDDKNQKDDLSDEENQFSKKLFLADIWHENFIITTFNQLLNTFFSNSNRDNLRLETLRDSVIIIDEIQNISRVLLKDLSFVLNKFGEIYNIDFIIMSATMPKLNLDNFQTISDDSFYSSKQNRYTIIFDENIKNIDHLVDKINLENKSTLCVVNTITKAKTIYKNLKKDENLYILTTHQTPAHRADILEQIKEKLNNGVSVKLIATQLIEAGVDLSFEVGFRELAPFPSIIQMAGRVNRIGKPTASKCFVFDFLEIENVDKKLPYQGTDLQEEFIKDTLKNGIQEIEIFNYLEIYFTKTKEETTHTQISKYMKSLEFQKINDIFNDNFMPKQPWKVSVFIESKSDEFREFIEKREKILESHPNKFEALAKIKSLEADLSNQTININKNLVEKLNLKETFGRYILNFGSIYYNKNTGFDIDITIEEEAFS
ncbi:CRISPR/Cas system-associated endonuclease/helicase Cas3, type I-B/HMARI [Campylobacter sputorum bv. paraureolyticus LMG 11764]|uniref:CRISPR-associated helicase Cas3' n=1 Tax=Campylobacter sputorum TaxID=206 RepID=UPI000B777540|nr:CRISPR-associated helicase Cas3' [Campylobacter sputorum]ASM38375.1 CRISPR/Cas system-associated endonuclease/helicase Cas3, type I-B/HMARI [Campylobacter sputorum bv. paraureolyticus LMG 11764]